MKLDDRKTFVLDACCGTKSFWFDKGDKRALYMDSREGSRIVDVGTPTTKGRKPRIIKPDIIADFRDMPFPDECFWHIVFDPPHLTKKRIGNGILAFNYGKLDINNWRDDIAKAFKECFRVLKPFGTLIFKWCETEIPLKEVLSLTDHKPLYGHRSGKKAMTIWVAFVKGEGI